MPNQNDIAIRLKFDQQRYPAGLLAQCIYLVNDAVYLSEQSELSQIQTLFPNIHTVSFDAARYRLTQYREQAFLIEEASKGSIVLTGLIAGLAIWLLQQTIGQTIKEAWQETELHNHIKNLLLKGKKEKASSIATNIENSIGQNAYIRAMGVEVKIDIHDESEGVIIIVYISSPKNITTPPSRDEIV